MVQAELKPRNKHLEVKVADMGISKVMTLGRTVWFVIIIQSQHSA